MDYEKLFYKLVINTKCGKDLTVYSGECIDDAHYEADTRIMKNNLGYSFIFDNGALYEVKSYTIFDTPIGKDGKLIEEEEDAFIIKL